MKKLLGIVLYLALLIWSGTALALPNLQLDISGGWYNNSGNPLYNDETIVSAGDVFTLCALMQKMSLNDTYYISLALFPQIPQNSLTLNFGSFIFAGQTINVTSDMIYGNPGIPSHDVFDTYYTERSFTFNTQNQVNKYNTQDSPGQFEAYYPGTGMYYAAFSVDTTNLSDTVSIHFDLFSKNKFAPFSHDADGQSDPPPVPEPTTMLLFGLGLIGVAGVRRKLKK